MLSGSIPTPANLAPKTYTSTAEATAKLIIPSALMPAGVCSFEVRNNDSAHSIYLGDSTVTGSGATLGRTVLAGAAFPVAGNRPDLWYIVAPAGTPSYTVTMVVGS